MEDLVMRRLFGTVVVVLFSAVLAVGQGTSRGRGETPGQIPVQDDRDDHNDGAPVQSGFGVVTPVAVTTGGTVTGLVVFETFGLRGGPSGTTQAGVLPPDLTTNSILFVDRSGRLSKNLGVAIVNPNGSDATVSLTLRKNDGTQLATSSLTVPSHKQTSKFITELFTG